MGCINIMHGRSLMTIDPRILTMPGRNTSGFYQPGRHCLHQARSAVACLVSRMKGELTPTKTRLRGGLGGVSVIPWTSSASINQDHQPQATLLKRCPEPKAGSFSCGSGTNSRSTSSPSSSDQGRACLLYTSPSPRDLSTSRMPSSA